MATESERRRHFRVTDGRYVWHSHPHTHADADFNRLHHHPPVEHTRFSLEELAADASTDAPAPGPSEEVGR